MLRSDLTSVMHMYLSLTTEGCKSPSTEVNSTEADPLDPLHVPQS